MNRLRGVCIGGGYFSRFHYDAWSRMPDVEIAAFSELDPDKARQVGETFGLAKHYSDYREMLDVERPDFVDVITPPPTHAAICAEAAQRGIPIICQKPLAPSLDEAQSIVGGAAAAGVRLMVHENFRFQPWHREIKRRIDAGAIGDRLHSLTFRSRPGDGWGADAYLSRQPYFRDYPRLLVYETGIHLIDTFRFLAGEITRVAAWLRRLNPVIRGEDCGLLVFEFAGGAIGQWDANRYNEPPPGIDPRYTFGEFLVEGNGGTLRLALDGRLTLQPLGREESEVPYHPERRGFGGDCVLATQRHFIDRLRDGGPFETSGEDYLTNLAVQDAVYSAASLRRPVELGGPDAQPPRLP